MHQRAEFQKTALARAHRAHHALLMHFGAFFQFRVHKLPRAHCAHCVHTACAHRHFCALITFLSPFQDPYGSRLAIGTTGPVWSFGRILARTHFPLVVPITPQRALTGPLVPKRSAFMKSAMAKDAELIRLSSVLTMWSMKIRRAKL